MIQGGGFDAAMKREADRARPSRTRPATACATAAAPLAMARTNDPDSATSQFFINVKDNTALDYGIARRRLRRLRRGASRAWTSWTRSWPCPPTTRAPHADVPADARGDQDGARGGRAGRTEARRPKASPHEQPRRTRSRTRLPRRIREDAARGPCSRATLLALRRRRLRERRVGGARGRQGAGEPRARHARGPAQGPGPLRAALHRRATAQGQGRRRRRRRTRRTSPIPRCSARITDGEIFWKIGTGLQEGGRDGRCPPSPDRSGTEDRWRLVRFVALAGGGRTPRAVAPLELLEGLDQLLGLRGVELQDRRRRPRAARRRRRPSGRSRTRPRACRAPCRSVTLSTGASRP